MALSDQFGPNSRRDLVEDLYENAPCGYLTIAPTGLIVTANRTVARWLGYDPEAMVGKRLFDVLTLGGRVYWETHLRPLLRLNGSIDGVALDFRTFAGETLPAFASAIEMRGPAGEAVATRLALFKAAERRQFEQSLLSARLAAEQANIHLLEDGRMAQESLRSERETAELREQFIAVLGHDLRNPLAGLAGGVRLLAKENLSEKASKIIPLMLGSVSRMSELIDNVMDFAKARLGGGINLDRNSLEPLGPTLLQVVQELKTAHPGRELQVSIAIDEPVDCDRARIGQLISNLLGNALTHGAPDRPIRFVAQTTSEFLELSVVNGGVEIPAEAMARLFQPFFRGEGRARQQGLGLGLHIASEIAKAHGGTLTAESSEHETRFTFRMPIP